MLSDRNVLYKYMNPHLVAFSTLTPYVKGSAVLHIYLLDTVKVCVCMCVCVCVCVCNMFCLVTAVCLKSFAKFIVLPFYFYSTSLSFQRARSCPR